MTGKYAVTSRVACFSCGVVLLLGLLASFAFCGEAVNIMLKNASSASVEVELIDQYGGNFKATVDAGMSQNHSLKNQSVVKVGDQTVYVVTAADEGKEVVIAGP